MATDGPGLLAYLRSQTLSDADQKRLTAAVRRLGDDSFEVREAASQELIARGRVARPFLKLALDDRDLEVVHRARNCLAAIQEGEGVAKLAAVVRLVVRRQPAGAAATLLAYLPWADNDLLEEAVFAALVEVGLRDGKPDPAVTAALADKIAVRRAAAAHVLGRSPRAGAHRPLSRLLADPNPRVRYEAAAAVVGAGDRAGVPVLIALLDDAPLPYAWQAEQVLYRLAGEQAPAASLGSGDITARRKCRDTWEEWWKDRGDRIDLARLAKEETLRGLTLVCEYDGAPGGGRVWEFDKGGAKLWEVTGLQGPNDVQVLPGGRMLVAERNGNQVTERDRQGKVLWRHSTPGSPIACQRLPSGNTLIVTWNDLLEVTPEHRTLHTRRERQSLRHAVRLPNGHVVYVAANGKIVELDSQWEEVRSIMPAAHGTGAGYWASVEMLPSGRFLLALGSSGRVVEVDGKGKIEWECSIPSPVFATRLRNGNTLVASFDGRCIIEVNRAGKEVRKQTLQGRPFAVRRY
jgi:hypothetical protein